MKTHKIIKRLLLILCLMVGWGSAAWAARFTPTFESAHNANGHWYNITYWTGGNLYAAQGDGEALTHGAKPALNQKTLWQLVGTADNFVLVSYDGIYAKWDNEKYVGTTTAADATAFSLINMQGSARADYWGIHRNDASANQVWNPQSNLIKEYNNNDNNSSVKFVEQTAVTMGTAALRFVDGSGNVLSDVSVKYTPANGGSAVTLTAGTASYDFEGAFFDKSRFASAVNTLVVSASYDAATSTLTFTFTNNPHHFLASAAPVDGKWAADTNWFIMRTNGRYYYPAATRVDELGQLRPYTSNPNENQGGAWAFVPEGGGYNIYNAAFGPDFLLGVTGSGDNARLKMYPKDNIPVWVTTIFTFPATKVTSLASGYKFGYALRAGTTGDNYVYFVSTANSVNNGYFALYTKNDASSILYLDAVDDFDTRTAFDVYKVTHNGVVCDDDVAYTPNASTFGRLSNAKDGNYLIVEKDSPVATDNFSVADTNYQLTEATTADVAGHSYKLLTLNFTNSAAVDYTLKINGGYTVNYAGADYADGDIVKVVNDAIKEVKFKVADCADKFIWGPVIDTQAKAITFEVRDLETDPNAFNDGLFQLMLKNDADVANVNGQIASSSVNANIQSNYIYLMPALGEAYADRPFKFSGTNSSNQASSFVRIQKTGSGYTMSYADGRSMSIGVSAFADGVVTLNKTISTNTDEPYELPYFFGNGSTEFYVTPAKVSDYYVYQLNLVGGTTTTSLTTSLTTLNGVKTFKNGDIIIVRKGTMFSKSDFTPSNARVTSISTALADPSAGKPYNVLTLNLETVKDEWICYITTPEGSGINIADYKVIYGGQEYADSETFGIAMGEVPAAIDFKTTCTDQFVWGPVIDAENRIVTFSIRPTITDLSQLQTGFYQLQLYDEYALTAATPTASMASVDKVNARMADNTVNTKSNYIYLMPYSDYCLQATNNMLKYNGVPNYADEPYSYIYITREGDKISIQQLDGRYPAKNERSENGKPSFTQTTISTSNIDFTGNLMGIKGWVVENTWTSEAKSTSKEGPLVAFTGSDIHERYLVTRPVVSNYKVYRVVGNIGSNVVTYSVGPHNYLSCNIHDGSFIFLEAGKSLPEFGAFTSQSSNAPITYTIGAAGADGIIPVTLTIGEAVTKTVIHRQHGSYDYLATLDPSLRPGDGYIQLGEGMEPKTLKNGTQIMVQHASNFEIDLYCKPGGTARLLLPHTQNQESGSGHMGTFQRWYDYDTELPLANGITTDLSGLTSYTNGQVSLNGNLNFIDITFPTTEGLELLNIACDCSDFNDGKAIGTNYLEPSLGYRVIYHIHNANLMAEELKTKTAAGKYLEEKEYFVPNVKYGRDTDGNKGDLIPVDLAWCNYWMYAADGTTLTQLIAPNTSTNDNNFRNKVVVEVDAASAALGLKATVLSGASITNGNIGSISTAKWSHANHFIVYYINNNNTRNVIPADHVATITVKLKPTTAADAPLYNLAKFTLKFVANAEPLALNRVIGPDAEHPISERSVDYFVKQNFQEIATLTFQQKDVSFNSPLVKGGTGGSGSHNYNLHELCYGVPLEFSDASYGYSYAHTWAQYKVSRMSYGLKYNPVALYEYNIKHPESTKCDIEDDYYLYIDAAEQPGKVASVPLEGNLCAGSRLYIYGWMGSSNRNTTGSGSVVLNLVGYNADGTKDVLARYLPGTISNVTYDEANNPVRSFIYGRTNSAEEGHWLENNPPTANTPYPRFGCWQQIGFSTILSKVGYVSYSLEIINNCYTTSGGDYCLDDFRVFINPPRAVVDFSTPVCSDEIEHIKIHTPFELLEDAATTVVGGQECYKVNYSFIDKAIYYGYFDEHCTVDDIHGRHPGDPGYVTTYREFTQADYNAAYNAALMGSGTNDYEVDGGGNKVKSPSFWNITVNKNFETLEPYHFANIVTGLLEGEAYREEVAGEKRVVMKRTIRPAEHWTPSRDYIVVFAKGWVESDFTHAATNVYALDHNCSFLSEFTIKPAIMVNSDVEYTAADALQACDGQSASMSICMIGIGPDGEKYKDRMTYDWWIGYGKGSHDPDVPSTLTDAVVPATVDNFLRLEYGGVELNDALDHFRACYTFATTLEGCNPCDAPDIYGSDYDFTQADYDCIAHFLRPNDLGRVPLILGRNAFNTRLESKDAVIEDGQKNIYITIIPITPVSAYDKDDNVIYCPAPQQVKVRLVGDAPSMTDGFGALTYPSDLQSIPVRAGLEQIEATKMNAAGVAAQTLRVPLRNVKTVNASELVVDKYSDGGETLDYVYLSGCDDPNYTDNYIAGVKDNILQFIPVGKVRVYSAKGQSKEAYMDIAFTEDFQPREGYTYTLKSRFAEEPVEGKTTPCPGSLYFDLKIVPKYQQWTGNYATDYTNDVNWARSDYDALHAGNAASDGTTPLAGYTTNADNYSKDARYDAASEQTAHGFVPMYFTNVLMRQPDCLAPVIYPMTKAPAAYPYNVTSGNSTGDFLQGLRDEATKLVQYDMLVTPIDASNKPLPLAQRYTAHSGNYGCEPFWTNICDGLTFQPGTYMYDAQHLGYRRAWVEYELASNRWYTLASPLQDTYAGEWYSPEDGGRQLTPHFYPVTYNEALNDRFHPAYYQRSWDKAGDAWIYSMPGDDNAYLGFTTESSPYGGNKRVTRPVLLNWGYVYNDVEVPYSQGGFSVKARYNDSPTVLVRMPKDDDAYYYYESEDAAAAGNTNSDGNALNPDGSNADPARPNGNGVYKGDYTTLTRTGHHRLVSDLLLDAEGNAGTIGQYIMNRSRTNPYFLVGNPLMTPIDMDQFFAANGSFVGGKYWIMSADRQNVSIKVGDSWISTTGDGGAVAPLQSFFVTLPTDTDGNAVLPAGSNGGVSLQFDGSMQKPLEQIGENRDGSPIYGFVAGETEDGTPIYGQKPQLRSQMTTPAATFRIHAATDGRQLSTAVVYFSQHTSNAYRPAEDAETLLDGNTANTVSTVFTFADEQALQINSMSTDVDIIPIGVIAPDEQTTTVLTFSGVGTLSSVMAEAPYLYDAQDDTYIALDADTQLAVTGTTVGRYFVVSGAHLPLVDEEAGEDTTTAVQRYNLNGVRVRTPQHGTVTVSAGRKEYAK